MERIQVFIDEANLMGAARFLNKNIDWIKMMDFLADGRKVSEVMVYLSLPPKNQEWAEARRRKERFVSWLKHNRFTVITRDDIHVGEGPVKGNMDVLMAADIVEWGLRSRPDVAILVTGDSDFAYVASKLRRNGVRVEVASIPQCLAHDLDISANEVINMTPLFDSFVDHNRGNYYFKDEEEEARRRDSPFAVLANG